MPTATRSGGGAKVTVVGETQIVIEREFAAPRHLVWRAFTTPELIRRWWTAKRGEATVVEVDLRVGGRWRYVMVLPDGYEVAFHGEYREIVENERLVSTEVFEAMPEGQAVNTMTLTESNGRTTMRILVEHEKREHRDAHIASGMEGGLQDALDLLEEAAASLA